MKLSLLLVSLIFSLQTHAGSRESAKQISALKPILLKKFQNSDHAKQLIAEAEKKHHMICDEILPDTLLVAIPRENVVFRLLVKCKKRYAFSPDLGLLHFEGSLSANRAFNSRSEFKSEDLRRSSASGLMNKRAYEIRLEQILKSSNVNRYL